MCDSEMFICVIFIVVLIFIEIMIYKRFISVVIYCIGVVFVCFGVCVFINICNER